MDLARGASATHARISILLCGALAALFLAGIVLVPLLERLDPLAGSTLRLLYRPLCHQIPERSITLEGRPLALCARCLGLYAAGGAGLLVSALAVSPLSLARRRWLVVALVPTLLDVLARFAGAEGLSNLPRFLSALPAGYVAGIYLAQGVADLASRPPWKNQARLKALENSR